MSLTTTTDECMVCVLRSRASDEPLDIGIATFVNPYSYLQLRKQVRVLRQFSRVYFDGSLMVLLARWMGIRVQRRSFDYTSFAGPIFDDAAATGKQIALVGSTEEELEDAINVFLTLSPGLKVAHASTGYFTFAGHREARLRSIEGASPEVAVIGMGTPLQEQFLGDLWAAGWRGAGYTCGGFIHQTAAAAGHYYPRVIDRLNLRWAYRMYREPQVRRRYFVQYPCALSILALDALRCRLLHRGIQ